MVDEWAIPENLPALSMITITEAGTIQLYTADS